MTPDVKQTVRDYIERNFLLDAASRPADGDSLLQTQVLDSTGFLELVTFLEATFGIKVADEEMVPENLETIENIDRFVRTKRAG